MEKDTQKEAKTTRPLILEVEDTKNEMVAAVNSIMQKHKIPAYFMETIIANIYNQIAAGARQELTQLKAEEAQQANKPKE